MGRQVEQMNPQFVGALLDQRAALVAGVAQHQRDRQAAGTLSQLPQWAVKGQWEEPSALPPIDAE
jgi:hypothetical protein